MFCSLHGSAMQYNVSQNSYLTSDSEGSMGTMKHLFLALLQANIEKALHITIRIVAAISHQLNLSVKLTIQNKQT